MSLNRQLGDRLIAAVGDPGAGEIAAAQMHAHRHVGRLAGDRGVEQLRIGFRQRRRILADIGDLAAQLRIAQIGEIDLVDLQIAAAGGGEVADFRAIDVRQIVVEFIHLRIGLGIDRLAAAAEMHDGRRRNGDLRLGLGDGFQELEIVDEDAAWGATACPPLAATAASDRACRRRNETAP